MKYVIINADDFGMCHSGNLAVFDLLEKGGITSSTIMAPCAWAREAAEFASKHPEYAIGVHLTTTSEWHNYRWAPVADGVPSLRDEEGFMWHESDQFEEHADLAEAQKEIVAQIEKLKKFGLVPSHLDNHMGSLYGIEKGRTELLEMTLGVCAQYRLPFRIPLKFKPEQMENETLDIHVPLELINGLFAKVNAFCEGYKVAAPDYLMPGDWAGPQKDSFENYREYIYELYRSFEDDAVTETYIHPILITEESQAITGTWQRRNWEYRLFGDSETHKFFDSIGVKKISYRDLNRMRGFDK